MAGMYTTHFGLRQRPFRSLPDPGCYYPATGHEHALQQLLQALDDGEALGDGPVRNGSADHHPEFGRLCQQPGRLDQAGHLDPERPRLLRLLQHLQ